MLLGENNFDQNDDRYSEWIETGQICTVLQHTPPWPLLQRMFQAPYSRIPGTGGKNAQIPASTRLEFVFVACFVGCNMSRM